MEDIVTYFGENIKNLSREELIRCIKVCKKDIDRREKMENERLSGMFEQKGF